jgi:hypothetical protein
VAAGNAGFGARTGEFGSGMLQSSKDRASQEDVDIIYIT